MYFLLLIPQVKNDPTFDFTKSESQTMDLNDIPIRIEHEEGLAVGKVKRNWTDSNGKKMDFRSD